MNDTVFESSLVASGSVNFNIVRMLTDHAPIRLEELERELTVLARKKKELTDERETLQKLLQVMSHQEMRSAEAR
jgi:hypothetical protein